jgi:uncharacterized membrane protein YgaE (UPF0421/DUF939 family)
MVNYTSLHDEINKNTIQLSKKLAEKRKTLESTKAKKSEYKQLTMIEKEINLNNNLLKCLMKLSLLENMEESE